MKIVIVGGRDEADFLIGFLLGKDHRLIVINKDSSYCEYLSATHQIPVVCGDPCKRYTLEDARIYDYDVLISLTSSDADNLAICQTAKGVFRVKKVVCTVSNPKNVEVFKQLGINTALSATYMVAQMLEQATTIENLIRTLYLADEKILLNEVQVDEAYPCVNQNLKDIPFPKNTIVGCILRGTDIIVPGGQTAILAGDKLLILSSPDNQKTILSVVTGD